MKFVPLILIALTIIACGTSEAAIQTAIAKTQDAVPTQRPTKAPTITKTLIPTLTKMPTRQKTATPRKTATPDVGTLTNPYPFGYSAHLTQTSEGETISFILSVSKVMRGQEAWSAIYAANMFNDAPPVSLEAIMVELSVENDSTNGILKLDEYDISIVTNGSFMDAFDYHPCCLKDAGFLEFDILLAPGGKTSGWIASAVSENDNSPILVIGADRNGRGGIYFSLASP